MSFSPICHYLIKTGQIKNQNIYSWLNNTIQQERVTVMRMERKHTFHSSCNTSASIFPGTLVAKILAISRRVTAIPGVA